MSVCNFSTCLQCMQCAQGIIIASGRQCFSNRSHDVTSVCFAGGENVVDWDFTLNELVPGEPLTAPVQALRCDGHQHAGHYLALPASHNINNNK